MWAGAGGDLASSNGGAGSGAAPSSGTGRGDSSVLNRVVCEKA